jgi:hypothetical protein
MLRRSLIIPAVLAATLLLTGCAGLGSGGSGGSGQVLSDAASTRLDLRLPTRAAVVQDRNTADVYLTDLSATTLARLSQGDIGPEVSGTLLHVHIFLNPKPGRTPIEDTAASATARLVVVARGQVGVYDGAGFLMPGRSLRKGSAAGTLRNAPTRLTRATEGFDDLLGSSRMQVSFDARSDEAAAAAIAGAIRTLAIVADPIDADPIDANPTNEE